MKVLCSTESWLEQSVRLKYLSLLELILDADIYFFVFYITITVPLLGPCHRVPPTTTPSLLLWEGGSPWVCHHPAASFLCQIRASFPTEAMQGIPGGEQIPQAGNNVGTNMFLRKQQLRQSVWLAHLGYVAWFHWCLVLLFSKHTNISRQYTVLY